MLPAMSVHESITIDRILRQHEDELIEETLADLPEFLLERSPRVMLENGGMGINRWLMFGRPPHVEWLELRQLSYYALTERYVDDPPSVV